MTKTIHGLDADGTAVTMIVASDCMIFIEDIEPDQVHQIKISTTDGLEETTEFIGERPRHEERN